MATYRCRDCNAIQSIDNDGDCLQCGAKTPWLSAADIEQRKMYDHWQAVENRHADAYRSLMKRFAWGWRFGNEVDEHVRKAHEAQAEKLKYR